MKKILRCSIATFLAFWSLCCFVMAQPTKTPFRVVGYFTPGSSNIDNIPVEKLTHIIFSFCHLQGNQLAVDNAKDSAAIKKLVALKSKKPTLKVLLSLGGWGGCEHCSEVFSTYEGRQNFAQSVKNLASYFKTDGIDLDWEYPAIEGYPGHTYSPADKVNFTQLFKQLRAVLGKEQELSFAAGGFKKYLEEAVDWKAVMPIINYVNLMNYDLVHGFSTQTGHHTPLFNNNQQKESVHACVSYLTSIGVPAHKMVIGAGFYGRSWGQVPNINHGLHQPGVFKDFIAYNLLVKMFGSNSGYKIYYDKLAMASYAYNVKDSVFITFDDKKSVAAKTQYALDKQLGGIMFWELPLDKNEDGLLNVIDSTIKSKRRRSL